MTDGMGGVQTGGANGMLSPEEQMRQKFEALQRDNVIYFPYDGYDIQGQYADLLDAHASYLRERPSVKVLIEGHADERGTPEYNIALGERRAKAVAKWTKPWGAGRAALHRQLWRREAAGSVPHRGSLCQEPPCGPGLLRFESNEVRFICKAAISMAVLLH